MIFSTARKRYRAVFAGPRAAVPWVAAPPADDPFDPAVELPP
jgi:hypothetical protein